MRPVGGLSRCGHPHRFHCERHSSDLCRCVIKRRSGPDLYSQLECPETTGRLGTEPIQCQFLPRYAHCYKEPRQQAGQKRATLCTRRPEFYDTRVLHCNTLAAPSFERQPKHISCPQSYASAATQHLQFTPKRIAHAVHCNSPPTLSEYHFQCRPRNHVT